MKEKDRPKKESQEKKPPLNSYVRYTAIAFQMLAMIVIGTGIGVWLDGKYQTETPWFTLGLALFSVFAAIYTTLKDFIGK